MWPKKLRSMPSVMAVMTPFPYSIDASEPLANARKMMSAHKIHHLPVMENGTLVGVISHRDLMRALDQGPGDGTAGLRVADAPREEAYVVDLSERLDRVLMHMARRRVGAALIVKAGRLAGIFTLTDACQCFAESLRELFPGTGGDEAA